MEEAFSYIGGYGKYFGTLAISPDDKQCAVTVYEQKGEFKDPTSTSIEILNIPARGEHRSIANDGFQLSGKRDRRLMKDGKERPAIVKVIIDAGRRMCVCVYVCMYVLVYVCVYVSLCVRWRIFVYVCAYFYVYVGVWVGAGFYIYMYMSGFVCVRARVCLCVYVCICMYAYMGVR